MVRKPKQKFMVLGLLQMKIKYKHAERQFICVLIISNFLQTASLIDNSKINYTPDFETNVCFISFIYYHNVLKYLLKHL